MRRALPELRQQTEEEHYRRLIPGYVYRFVERAAPLVGLRVEGDPEEEFALAATQPRALDFLLTALETYPAGARNRLTVHKPDLHGDAVWLHPGEPVFDRLAQTVIVRHGEQGLRGAVFVDPYAEEPYLVHAALATVEQEATSGEEGAAAAGARILDSRLVGLRQSAEGDIEEWPVERLLLLRGAPGFAPGREPLAARARKLSPEAEEYARADVLEQLVQAQRRRLLADLPDRQAHVRRGYGFQAAELAARRANLVADVRAGDANAQRELARVKARQRSLNAARRRRLAELEAEADNVRGGEFEFLAHALVVPASDPEIVEQFDVQVEKVAMEVATSFEESRGARVHDVSRPDLARRASLPAWPGFDILSVAPGDAARNIEVKGRARAARLRSATMNGPRPAICVTITGCTSFLTARHRTRGLYACATRSASCSPTAARRIRIPSTLRRSMGLRKHNGRDGKGARRVLALMRSIRRGSVSRDCGVCEE